jgi:hypothetical protein
MVAPSLLVQGKPPVHQLGEIGRPEASNWIPAFTRTESQSATSRVCSFGDIMETACKHIGVYLQKCAMSA